jgi:putative sugar O-methyltransferase
VAQTPELIFQMDEFKDNDIEGGAITKQYELVGAISPSTLRYIKVASDIKKIFGDFSFEKIAEIGVGYGGQLLINDKVFKFKEYHLFDLPPVLNLTEKYLESHNLNNSYKSYTLNQHSGSTYYDLSISNYAFSELPSKLQMKYIDKIFSKSLRGYLTMNSGLSNSAFQSDKLSLQDLKNHLPKFEVIEERPLTHSGNYIIIWGI